MFYIENLFSKVSENVGKLIDEKNQKIRVLQDAAERFEECSKILGKTSSELREIKGKTDMISKKSQEEVYYYEIRERAWNREKAQLETKVEMLCEQLENYRGLGTNEDVEKEIHKHTLVMEENINQFKKKITTLKKVISKLQLELGLAKTEISDKSTFFSEFSSIKQGLEAVIDDCKENEDELNKKLK